MVVLLEENKEDTILKQLQENVDEIKLNDITSEKMDNEDIDKLSTINSEIKEKSDLEIVQHLLDGLISSVEKLQLDDEVKGRETSQKGILKHERSYSNKHVDFNLSLEFIPYDPKKDYTVEIQFVEKLTKRVVSYAALYAKKKAEEEQEADGETK